MEVGAVKQAFNNEVILLKKKLNQAKIQTIRKLTRKAKQLVEKKAPDPLKEKLKRKAEAAVNEVLIIKKINPKILAEFIVTHKGELKSFLNKPTVDNDKACARLLLHKALQEKYEFIRGRFSNVAIKDLFMSRLERRKIKKEEREKQKNKKKAKDNKVVNFEGDWNVEEVSSKNKLSESNNDSHEFSDGGDYDDDNVVSDGDDDSKPNQIGSQSEEEDSGSKISDVENESDENVEMADQDESENSNLESAGSKDDEEVSSLANPTPKVNSSLGKCDKQQVNPKQKHLQDSNNKPIEKNKKKPEQKQKEISKTKNFSEKIMKRKLKKDKDESVVANKIVDPFFITSSGENYMSVVEPRAPDEVKKEHKQGNRKLRRAAMFGLVPKKRTKNYNSYTEDNRFSQNSYDNVNKCNFNRQDNSDDNKPEKLHPSWEAKRMKSGILPYEGKKIVFD